MSPTKVTRQYEVFKFDELSDDAKKKALESQQHCNVDDSWWYEGVYDMWEEKLEKMGFSDVKINFSGFWSQGDGASFTAEIDLEKWIKVKKYGRKFASLLNYCRKNGYSQAIVKRISYHYSHENTVLAYLEWEQDMGKKVEFQMEECQTLLTECVRNLSKQIYKDLEKEYEYFTSDECVKDTIKSNGWTFDESGHLFNP